MADQKKLDNAFMEMAITISKLSNCVMHQVGCIIVKDNRVISTGYNGSIPGFDNCNDLHSKPMVFGPGPQYTQEEKDAHHEFSKKFEIHGELNSILFAAKNGISIDGGTMYCTLRPCHECLKNICQVGIKRIVFKDIYKRHAYCENINRMIEASGLTIEQL
jgi:dCMP deaminase